MHFTGNKAALFFCFSMLVPAVHTGGDDEHAPPFDLGPLGSFRSDEGESTLTSPHAFNCPLCTAQVLFGPMTMELNRQITELQQTDNSDLEEITKHKTLLKQLEDIQTTLFTELKAIYAVLQQRIPPLQTALEKLRSGDTTAAEAIPNMWSPRVSTTKPTSSSFSNLTIVRALLQEAASQQQASPGQEQPE